MTLGVQGIDHPVIAVRDMDEGRGAYERLGFTIPPRGSHLEWGTGNWCIMFPDDYLELRGIVDATRYTHGLDSFLAQREGLMGVALSVSRADESFDRARASGLSPREPRELTRRFELAAGDAFPKFRLVFLDPQDAPGLMGALMIEHLTPSLIRSPEWLRHPNTAVAVHSMTAVLEEPARAREAYDRLFGAKAVSAADGRLTVEAGRGSRIELLSPAEAERRGLALDGAELPYLSGVAVAVADIDETARVLSRKDVPFARSPTALRVGPEHSCGIHLDFVPR